MDFDALRRRFADALAFARRRVRRLVDANPAQAPLYTERGRWAVAPTGPRWGDGFLPGMMWLFAAAGDEEAGEWAALAERHTRALDPLHEDRAAHDLGLIFYQCAHRPAYEASVRRGRPDDLFRRAAVRAGQVLALRFRPAGQYLHSFAGPESLTIGSMANVPLLFYAAREMGDEVSAEGLNAHEVRRRAMQHCLAVQRVLCRGDGSTAQEALFDPATGEFLRHGTRHGFRPDSCWARGLAWGLHGFTTCHDLTRDRRLLRQADALAEFWLTNTPLHGVPPWDFDAPLDGPLTLTQPDSSAAAIAASALLTLAQRTADRLRAMAYEDHALRTLATLTAPPYLVSGDDGWEGILRRGVYRMHQGGGVDESTAWGDYFLVEALGRATALL